MRNGIIGALITLTLVIVQQSIASAQHGGTTRFVYDDNGRLTSVIAPNGEAAIYDYDAAGNFTAIRRISADTLMLLAFFPHEGGARDEVTFVGTGFNAGATSVSFNGVAAQISSVTPLAVVAVVPDNASSGPVTIVTPRGTLVTPVPFTMLTRVRVFPSAAILLPSDSVALTAIVGGSGDQTVSWAVNGIPGGNNTVGTISTTGLYAAPAALSGNVSLSVLVRATSVAQPALFGEAQVKVLNPNSVGAAFAHSLSLRRGDPDGVRAARGPLVSVRRGAIISTPLAFMSSPLSLRFGFSAGTAPGILSPFVSVTAGPAISSIVPGSIARGASVTLTINGANLTGASLLRFIGASGAIDTAIATSNLSLNADGTRLTATVTVSSGAATGARVVLVTAGAGSTSAVTNGSNTITIQ
ncbi:MAG TPA: IPT/TIG domain-containing protein [Blastocatellia bacterium]|nr:IPT/TIG domain-containing protein [Blastocatellia bacterium]